MTIFSGRRTTMLLIGSAIALTYLISEQTELATGAGLPDTPLARPGSVAITDETELTPLALLQETVDRPLFSPTRRAPKETRTVAATTGIERGNYDLVGVILTDNRRIALIRSAGADRTLRVTVGQRLDRWRVTEIEARIVVLSQRGETQELRLHDQTRARPARIIRPDAVAGEAGAAAEANAEAAAAEPVS